MATHEHSSYVIYLDFSRAHLFYGVKETKYAHILAAISHMSTYKCIKKLGSLCSDL